MKKLGIALLTVGAMAFASGCDTDSSQSIVEDVCELQFRICSEPGIAASTYEECVHKLEEYTQVFSQEWFRCAAGNCDLDYCREYLPL